MRTRPLLTQVLTINAPLIVATGLRATNRGQRDRRVELVRYAIGAGWSSRSGSTHLP
jgi:hypothetical protein